MATNTAPTPNHDCANGDHWPCTAVSTARLNRAEHDDPELDTPTLTAILCAETAATYRGQDETVTIPKADLLLILAAARR